MRYRTRNGLRLTSQPAHADHATYLLQHEVDQPDDPPFWPREIEADRGGTDGLPVVGAAAS